MNREAASAANVTKLGIPDRVAEGRGSAREPQPSGTPPPARGISAGGDQEKAELEKKFQKLPTLDIPTPSMNRLGITRETLNSPCFRGTIRVDSLGNAVLGQRARSGFCGVERVGEGQASVFNGQRGCWVSNAGGSKEAKLVLTATPTEAMAYHQLHPAENVRYLCTGAADLTQEQKESLRMALAAVPKLASPPEVVLAFSRDVQGEKLAREVSNLCREITQRRHAPEFGADWTQTLALRQRQRSLTLHQRGPSRGLEM